ncbi:hypothetical protein CSUI_001781 [Cystoisospora suis]|uniref:Uncharacterized protein n=1 Tax=Cystoisospora suis TaxID=483139 RepID=A0A2C6L7A5_9APIC|nr:hypothetical protein CSUI_001781 [Cystoisospora suis]
MARVSRHTREQSSVGGHNAFVFYSVPVHITGGDSRDQEEERRGRQSGFERDGRSFSPSTRIPFTGTWACGPEYRRGRPNPSPAPFSEC